MADSQGVVAPGNQREQSSVISERWKQVEALFEQVVEGPTTERLQFLNTIGDDELRREVESLLQAHDQAGAFIDEPDRFFSSDSLGENGASFSPGEIIDRYRVIREIGRGGMGAVFLAERADDQYQKQVAIKLIKRGMDTESVLRHFRNERQILAGFDHPNIARLFDGGTTESGLPYFVMEYVEGLPIDDYCNVHALSVVERLKLFREVCAAVSYAHRHLVIHRDIKRSNILITAEGAPKLLDFGIAKILQPGDEPLATMTGMRLMTPEYASPEQARGQPVTTASDVYSLGVVLYELLSGRAPYKFPSQSPHEMARVITETEPKKPSTGIARSDGSSKSQIPNPKLLRGDLDNIVLMALRKEPERRYQSVEQFSEDIRRHLESRPVHARKDTFGYRSAKFMGRNKAALAAAALVLLILIGGIIATSRQAHIATREKARAERRFNDVRKLANTVLFDYYDAIKNLPGATKVRERLVKDGLNYLDSLAGEAHGDPELQRELAAAYERVGDVRGGSASGGSLGDLSGAIESYTKASRIREALVVANPGNVQARRDLATSHQKIGSRLLDTAEASNGLEHLRKAFTLRLDLTREQPANDDLQFDLALTRNQLGVAMGEGDDLVGALEQHRAALAICEKLVAKKPREQKYRRALCISGDRLGYVLWLHNDVASAIEANSKALALGEALIADDPINVDYRRRLVMIYYNGGDIREQSDKRGALELFRKAAALDEELLAADPGNALTHRDLGYTHKRIADFLVELEDNSQALLHFSKALESYERVVMGAPADLYSRFMVAIGHAGVARMQARLGEVDLALEECRKAIALLQEITGDKPGNLARAEGYEYLGYAYAALAASPKASASESRQHLSAARDLFRQALNIFDDSRKIAGGLGVNEVYAKAIAVEIAKCDAALGK
jgi:tetratricopeptide (TPR) repeat protein/tRNA A-37 threonylcarbamoyl transferase component Bud32